MVTPFDAIISPLLISLILRFRIDATLPAIIAHFLPLAEIN